MSDLIRVRILAQAFVAGEQELSAIVRRGADAIGRPAHMVKPVAERFLATFATRTRPRHRDVVQFLLHDRSWLRRKRSVAPRVTAMATTRAAQTAWPVSGARMHPVPAAAPWPIPSIESVSALAEWLSVSVAELEWFADVKGRNIHATSAKLHHYRYAVRAKRRGGLRLIEAPQARLKAIQRRILTGILDHVPPYYTAAHGFVKGRSIRTFAAEHVAKHVVLRLDLQDFFPCISGARVQTVFRTLGYPEAVADLLGGLCTNATPRAVFGDLHDPSISHDAIHDAVRTYTRPHVPQGAPTSPALANICAFRLDVRLTGLADWAGATYSRYADDLAFSGDEQFARRVDRYATQIAAIALEEGWHVQHRKTRIMRRGVQQHLAGLVVNRKVNISRRDFDALKATLTNCVRHGPTTQNLSHHEDFRAHLRGRIAWVASVNPIKARKLESIFAEIVWR